jgi:hypothetical protein
MRRQPGYFAIAFASFRMRGYGSDKVLETRRSERRECTPRGTPAGGCTLDLRYDHGKQESADSAERGSRRPFGLRSYRSIETSEVGSLRTTDGRTS